MSKTAPRIRWDADELAAFERAAEEFYLARPGALRIEALRSAQNALPFERRRRVTHQAAHNLRVSLERAWQAARRSSSTPAVTPPQSLSAPARPRPEVALGEVLEWLVQEVCARLGRPAAGTPAVQPAEPVPQPLYSFDSAEARRNLIERTRHRINPAADLRPGVLVLGMQDAQVAEVFKNHPGLKLDHMTAEAACTRPVMRRAYTVLMTKFLSHKVSEKYRRASGLVYCNGGASELSAILNKIEKDQS